MDSRDSTLTHRSEPAIPENAVHMDADSYEPFAFNQKLWELSEDHDTIVVHNPRARHNLGVGVTRPVRVLFLGGVGYYCGGFNNGAHIEIHGNAGWGLGEAMAAGTIVVHGNSAWAAGASMRGGTVVVHGNGGPRTGVAQKGGSILVRGSVGFLSGFMAHSGKLVALSGASDALATSLYEGRVFVAGPVKSLGADAIYDEPTPEELAEIHAEITEHGLPMPTEPLRKVVAEGRLWYFDVRDAAIWRTV
jgi:methylamine---glutamate N-methyltransferase subunit B